MNADAMGTRWLYFGGDRRGGKLLAQTVCALVLWLLSLGSNDPSE